LVFNFEGFALQPKQESANSYISQLMSQCRWPHGTDQTDVMN